MDTKKKTAILSKMAQTMSEISGVKIQGFYLDKLQAEVLSSGLQETKNKKGDVIHVTYVNGFRIQTKDPEKITAGAFVRWYDIVSDDGRPSTFWGID